MELLMAMFQASIDLAILLLVVVAVYLGHRVIHGIRVYFRFSGARLVTCPETHEDAVVEVAAKCVGMQAMWDKRCLRLSECSRWPTHGDCRQECLRQIEARPTELRFSTSCRAS
jgi:hypothetical protein